MQEAAESATDLLTAQVELAHPANIGSSAFLGNRIRNSSPPTTAETTQLEPRSRNFDKKSSDYNR
jgi:hypothetical protein